MNQSELEEKWNQIKSSLKQKYAKWFEDDQSFADGKLEDYIRKIQKKNWEN